MPRFSSHHYQLPHLNFDRQPDLVWLYVLRVAHDFTNRLGLYFFPVYLYVNGAQFLPAIKSQPSLVVGITALAVFFIIVRASGLLLAIPVAQLTYKIGHQRMMIMADALRCGMFAALLLTGNYPWLIWVAAALEGLVNVMFWPSYLSTLSVRAHRTKIGADLGLMQMFLELVAIMSPALAGLVSVSVGLISLFFLGMIGSLVSLMVTMQLPGQSDTDRVSWREFRAWTKEKRFTILSLGLAGRYVADSTLFLWPLYVFLILGSVERVGYLHATALFGAFVMTYVFASALDRLKTRRGFAISGLLVTVGWGLRALAQNPLGLGVADAISKISGNFYWLYFDMVLMRRGKGSQAHSYYTYREVVLCAVGILFWIGLAAMFWVGVAWRAFFVLAIIGTVVSLALHDRHRQYAEEPPA